MKKLILIPVILFAAIVWADRTDVWLASSVNVYQVQLNVLPDGGCSVCAWATYTKADGGSSAEGMNKCVELAGGGANQTECLDITNVKAPVLFKNDKGL